MYKGKRTNSKSSAGMKRKLAVLVALVLVMSMGFGATLAYLIDNTGDVQNVFTPAEVPPTIEEPGWQDGNSIKENVKVTNDGNVSAYIRAAVVATWQEVQTVDDEIVTTGNVAPTVPVAGTDYNIVFNTEIQENPAGQWIFVDGYYYWSDPVDVGKSTDILIKSASPIVQKDGYRLVIEVLAQTIQAKPASVVADKWGVTVNADGTISK